MPESRLVLIVDDDARNLKLVRDVLIAAGFRTLVAPSGSEAVALAAEHVPDVILMDLRLPDMDGAEAAAILSDGPTTAAIPVVALTGAAFEGDTVGGFAGYLAKPIDVESFPHQVRGFCAWP